MQDRYLVFLPDRAGAAEARAEAFARYGQDKGYVLTKLSWLVALTRNMPLQTRGSETESVVIGSIIGRGERAPRDEIDDNELKSVGSAGIARSGRYWGDYVEFARCGDRCSVLRAPFGNLACYYASIADGLLVASDPLLLRDPGGVSLSANWEAIARHLVAPGLRRRSTCLAPLNELTGGERLVAGAGAGLDVSTFWSPWQHVAEDPISRDPDTAAAYLRAVICDAVAAQTARYSTSLLLLSGGLDSSIAAAALANSGRVAIALNMVTRAAGGDERTHARRVAEHCGLGLCEVVRDVAKVDVTRSLSAAQPYPTEKSFRQATMTAATLLAGESGADAILDGGGGDNIFCSLQSAAPLADLLRRCGPGRRAAALTRDIATIAQASHGAVLRQAASRLLWRSPAYRWHGELTLLTPLGRSYAEQALAHPWLDPPVGALPGKAGHIGLILSALGLVQSPSATDGVPSRSILLAQPVVEACLAIPTWLWYERGRNRAVARRAFAPLLPEANAWRQSKGAMDSFIVEIFEANRPRLREMLADGELAKSGLLDREATLAAIDAQGPVRGRAFDRVLDFADIEAWHAAWR